jgi:glyoxylase-like metal-dependent hydrolase (beta-lactamase superfamily II)
MEKTMSQPITFIPTTDQRIRTFRRHFVLSKESLDMDVDAYVIITERYVVVCDTLLCPEDMATVMSTLHDTLAGRQLLVINSHADWDHCWGNHYFAVSQPAPIIAHMRCQIQQQSSEAREELTSFQQQDPIFQNVVLTPPTFAFTHELTIDGGDLTLTLFHTPGHTPDHVALWIPQIQLLLAFDAVEHPLPVIGNVESVADMFTTLKRLQALQPQQVLFSHGNTTNNIIAQNLAYLYEIERRSRELLRSHRPTEAELAQAAILINYTFDDAFEGIITQDEHVDRIFYMKMHDNNVRYLLLWLQR